MSALIKGVFKKCLFFNFQYYVTSSSPTLGCYWSSESCQPIGFDLTLHFYCVLNDQNFCRSLASITRRNVPEHQQNKICCNTQYEASNEIPISDRQLMLQIIVQILGERAWTKGWGAVLVKIKVYKQVQSKGRTLQTHKPQLLVQPFILTKMHSWQIVIIQKRSDSKGYFSCLSVLNVWELSNLNNHIRNSFF